VADLVKQHRSLTLGETKSVTGFTVTVGHATFTLGTGTVSTVLAGETPVGLFLHGEGWLKYEVANKDELTALRYNAKLAHWKADASDANKWSIIPMANRLKNPATPYAAYVTRTGLIYAKGAYLLAALHRELGDQMFLTFLKSYQKSFRWKSGTTKDVIGLLNFITKKDYGPWFEQYFYGTAMPEIAKK
jgi:hypothetical protein